MPTGIEHAGVVDLVSEEANGEVALIMIERRPWQASQMRLQQIQDKVNTYLSFAKDGQLHRMYPQTVGRPIRIQIDCPANPDGECARFLDQLRNALKMENVGLTICVVPPTSKR